MGRAGKVGVLLAAGALIEACLIGILSQGDLRERVPFFLALFCGATALYLAAVWKSREAPLWLVAVFGLLFRATLLPAPPTLSDDIYRYVWDGRVQAAGINPYRYAPASEALAHLRDGAIYPGVNHPEIPTIYPPAAQALFLACYALSPTLWMVKAALVGIDLLAAWLLLGLIRAVGGHPGHLLIYLWNPLLIVEVAGSGHIDILGVAFLILALFCLQSGRFGWAAGALGLSVLSKFFAVCLAPALWCWMRSGRGEEGGLDRPVRAWPALAFAGVVLLGYLPYVGAGAGLFRAFLNYAGHWEFNASVFGLLRGLPGDGAVARTAIGAAFACTALVLGLRRTPPLRAGYLLTGLFLLLSPTVHPWYALWMLPFLVFYRNPAWLTFTGLIALSYHVLIRYTAEGIWEEALWVRGVEYGGFAGVWAGAWMWRRFRTPPPTPPPEGEGSKNPPSYFV